MRENEQNYMSSVHCSREWQGIWWCGSSDRRIPKNSTISARGEQTELVIVFTVGHRRCVRNDDICYNQERSPDCRSDCRRHTRFPPGRIHTNGLLPPHIDDRYNPLNHIYMNPPFDSTWSNDVVICSLEALATHAMSESPKSTSMAYANPVVQNIAEAEAHCTNQLKFF
jgi:hypothetical protein